MLAGLVVNPSAATVSVLLPLESHAAELCTCRVHSRVPHLILAAQPRRTQRNRRQAEALKAAEWEQFSGLRMRKPRRSLRGLLGASHAAFWRGWISRAIKRTCVHCVSACKTSLSQGDLNEGFLHIGSHAVFRLDIVAQTQGARRLSHSILHRSCRTAHQIARCQQSFRQKRS